MKSEGTESLAGVRRCAQGEAVVPSEWSWVAVQALLLCVLSTEVFAANGITVCGQCSQEHLCNIAPGTGRTFLPFLQNSLFLGDSLPPHP